MNDPRRFDEREIALIFERASAEQQESRSAQDATDSDGLTLHQLHEIGRDVGISADQITRAAVAVERGELVPATAHKWLGLPVGVAHTVDFDRPVSETEWARLVVTLRDTFGAHGRIESQGPFREWRNGNLRAVLEPTTSGHRLRLSTKKGSARGQMVVAGMYLPLAAVFGTLAATGAMAANAGTAAAVLFGTAGAVMLGSVVFGLPRWAKVRAEQMKAVAEQTTAAVHGSGNASVKTIPSSTS